MAFQTSLSGLTAAQTNLSVTGNNIANASTTGFKRSRAEFADIYATSIYSSANTAVGQGVKVAAVAQQFAQGNIDFTNNPLDLAISGEGFFRLSDNGAITYSRAGMFKVDRDGFVVNNSGQNLTGYIASATGTITGALGNLQIDTSNMNPSATGALTPNGGVAANLNLNANSSIITLPFNHSDPTTYNNSTSLTIYDSLGNPLLQTMYYVKTGTNTWNTHMWLTYTDTAGNITEMEVPPAGGTAGTPATMLFNTDGTLNSVTPAVAGTTTTIDYNTAGLLDVNGVPINLTAVTGGSPLLYDVAYAGTTQFGSPFSVNMLTQDGYPTGQLAGIDVDKFGVLFARYTNGQSRALGQVALATFINPQGLAPQGDTVWAETYSSGQPLVSAPGSGTLGLIQSSALESSNVDISQQLVNMIVAQRDFQANAKMISTEDAITQTIINIR